MQHLVEDATTVQSPDAVFQQARDLIQSGRTGLAQAHGMLTELLPKITHAQSRGRVNQMIWSTERALGLHPQFFSEAGQDSFLDREVFRGKRGGTFVEIGGYDGVTGSNCLYFEMMRGWNGLMIEPSPVFFERASAFRRATCLDVALAAFGSDTERRLVLLSDGRQNVGDAGRAAASAAAMGVTVYGVALDRAERHDALYVQRLLAPDRVRQAEPFEVELIVALESSAECKVASRNRHSS